MLLDVMSTIILCVKEIIMNKKLWARCLMAGVLSMSLFVVAGCGDSKEDKQARFEKAQ